MAAMEVEMVEEIEAAEVVVMDALLKVLVPNQGGTEHSELFTAGVMELAIIWTQTAAIHSQAIKTTQPSKVV